MLSDYELDIFSPYKLTDEDVYVISGKDLKEALALAEKGNQTSTKEIFGMESAYKEAVSKPFNNMCISTNIVIEMINHIKRLETFEKSRWKYPDKGELPEILSKYIIFYLNGSIARPRIGMAYKDKDGIFIFFCNDTKQGYPKTQVKAWTYAPVWRKNQFPGQIGLIN